MSADVCKAGRGFYTVCVYYRAVIVRRKYDEHVLQEKVLQNSLYGRYEARPAYETDFFAVFIASCAIGSLQSGYNHAGAFQK